MSKFKEESSKDFFDNPFNNDDIDLSELINIVKRYKKLVVSIILLSGIFGAIYSLSIKKTWQGEFKIVVDNEVKEKSSLSNAKSLLSGSSNLFNVFSSNLGGNSNLNTEIEILRSPSVLMPIFKYVVSQKNILEDSGDGLKIDDWINSNLKINLKRGTTVLTVEYKDNNKELIKPVLNKISTTYQEYTSLKKQRNLKTTLDFLTNQISNYKIISKNSFEAAQKYALENDLTESDIIPKFNEKVSSLPSNFRNTSQQFTGTLREEIRNTNALIKYVQNIDDESILLENILYFGPQSGIRKKIGILDLKISEYKSILNENDNDIRDLERSKLALLKTLKSQTLAYLEGEKARLISQQESTERPTSVLLKYKSLKKDSARDELTLNTLESEYRVLLLEQARSPKPWKLITVPTVLSVSPPNILPSTIYFSLFL